MVSIIGSSENKTFPLEYMAKIVDYIAESSDCAILFNYIPNQIDDAKHIYNACKKSTQDKVYFDLLGNNLRTFIALVEQCDYIIGNDGGAINMAKALNKPSFIIFSPWINKKTWATFEDGIFHKSVHLKDFLPELFIKTSTADLKKQALQLYQQFDPLFIKEPLEHFIQTVSQKNLSEYTLATSVVKKRNTPLTALVITFNEEENIEALIKNLHFADHIIIIDSYSTDQTLEKIKPFKHVRVIQRAFTNFSDQRNFALQQVTTDWVLFIDADERVTPKLKTAIQTAINLKNNTIVAYEMYRTFYFKKSIVRFGGWQTDKVFRLYKKDSVTYRKDLLVHELLTINGETAILKPKLDHFSFNTFTEYRNKMMHYAKLRAKELFIKKLQPNVFHFYIKPLYRFVNHYFFRLGFLDGKKGLIISYLNALYVYHRYIELKQLYRKQKNN